MNFVQPSTRDTLEYLATKLVENGTTDKISKVYDQFLNFLCVETNFFTLDLKDTFINVRIEPMTFFLKFFFFFQKAS